MTIEALLQNAPTLLKLDDVKSVNIKRFTVADYAELKDILENIVSVLSKYQDEALKVAILLTKCLKESCILIAVGSDLEVEEILNLDTDGFSKCLGAVISKNNDFFMQAALSLATKSGKMETI